MSFSPSHHFILYFMFYFFGGWPLVHFLLQAEDRTHRLGQTKAVTVLNLDARFTIDEVLFFFP